MKTLFTIDKEPDYAYAYTIEQDKTITFEALPLPLFNHKNSKNTSNILSNKTDGLFQGIFKKEAPSTSNTDLEKQTLKSKYTLKDTSLPQLESGLRTAANNRFNDIQKFINFGVKVNAQSPENLKTPLHYAVEKRHVESIEVLLKLDAEINISDNSGQTVLDLFKRI